jgi:hypothetical protein
MNLFDARTADDDSNGRGLRGRGAAAAAEQQHDPWDMQAWMMMSGGSRSLDRRHWLHVTHLQTL